jgi:23S rRNA pseudouridine2605 synthase
VVGQERLQKVLAAAGVASRRQVEAWIREGRITVGNRVASLGDRIGPGARVAIDGRPVRLERPRGSRVYAYHKPEGRVCTRSDPEGRPTVFEQFPPLDRGRWILVGRLDFNTSGLLLITDDGELAARLMHPRHELEREYFVRVLGRVPEDALRRLKDGIVLDGRRCAFKSVDERPGGEGANRWYRVVLGEGRYREVRRLFEAVGLKTSRLIRTRFGPVVLPRDLHLGKCRPLDPASVETLREAVGSPPERASGRRR